MQAHILMVDRTRIAERVTTNEARLRAVEEALVLRAPPGSPGDRAGSDGSSSTEDLETADGEGDP